MAPPIDNIQGWPLVDHFWSGDLNFIELDACVMPWRDVYQTINFVVITDSCIFMIRPAGRGVLVVL